MKEHGMYFGKNEFYQIIRNIGGTWNDSKERPVICLMKSLECDNLYWAIPVGNYEHRDEKAKERIQKYICFRNLEKETNNAIALFGDKEAGSIVLLKNFESYYNGYDENGKHFDGYVELIDKLKTLFPLGAPFEGEKAEKAFIMLYGAILRMKNILSTFDDFEGKEILSGRDFQDYQSEYIDFYQKYKSKSNEKKENINDDVVFEIELVKQVEINIDYILMLVKKYQQEGNQNK